MRKCPRCGSEMILGIAPGSTGWCKAECDLSPVTTSTDAYSWYVWVFGKGLDWNCPVTAVAPAYKSVKAAGHAGENYVLAGLKGVERFEVTPFRSWTHVEGKAITFHKLGETP